MDGQGRYWMSFHSDLVKFSRDQIQLSRLFRFEEESYRFDPRLIPIFR